MATAKKKKDQAFYVQWKVVQGVSIDKLARELEKLSESNWKMVQILGPLGGGLAIVATRLLTL